MHFHFSMTKTIKDINKEQKFTTNGEMQQTEIKSFKQKERRKKERKKNEEVVVVPHNRRKRGGPVQPQFSCVRIFLSSGLLLLRSTFTFTFDHPFQVCRKSFYLSRNPLKYLPVLRG